MRVKDKKILCQLLNSIVRKKQREYGVQIKIDDKILLQNIPYILYEMISIENDFICYSNKLGLLTKGFLDISTQKSHP